MIRVLVAHEAPLMGNLVSAVLRNEPDMEVVGSIRTAAEAAAYEERSDVVLVRSEKPGGAFELSSAIAKQLPTAKIIVTGAPETEETIMRYAEAGVAGYVLESDSVEHMLLTIRAVHGSAGVIASSLTTALMTRVAQLEQLARAAGVETGPMPESERPSLTAREREVLQLVARGMSNAEIADSLTLELGTVKTHVHNILDKLNVSSRHEAAAYLATLEHDHPSQSSPEEPPVHHAGNSATPPDAA